MLLLRNTMIKLPTGKWKLLTLILQGCKLIGLATWFVTQLQHLLLTFIAAGTAHAQVGSIDFQVIRLSGIRGVNSNHANRDNI
jgi:hypothetical protein